MVLSAPLLHDEATSDNEDSQSSISTAEEPLISHEVEQDVHQARVERLLYASHFLSTWNSRLFEFGAFLFLASIYPDTLLPASVYALARAAAAALLSPWIGSYIDRTDRLVIIRISIVVQRLATLLSCAVFAAMLSMEVLRVTSVGYALSLTLLTVLACTEKLAIVLNTISVERDWVIVISGTDEGALSRLNARMRRIDLFCKLVAPLAVSLLDSYSTLVAVIATGGLGLVSCVVEYFAIARVYWLVPDLRYRESIISQPPESNSASAAVNAIKTYSRSPALLPSLALSFLYLTALSFNGQLITYLLAPPASFSALSLSLIRGVAACTELSVTFIAPRLIRRIGPVRAGSWFLNGQLLFVGIAAAALWMLRVLLLQGQLFALITAVVLSRFGLWGFDLAAQQQIQDGVAEASRGTFSAVEAAMQNLLEMLSFAATIIWSRPQDFKYPGAISAGAVLTAAILYAAFVRQQRGHLIHWDQALCGSKYWHSHFQKPLGR